MTNSQKMQIKIHLLFIYSKLVRLEKTVLFYLVNKTCFYSKLVRLKI